MKFNTADEIVVMTNFRQRSVDGSRVVGFNRGERFVVCGAYLVSRQYNLETTARVWVGSFSAGPIDRNCLPSATQQASAGASPQTSSTTAALKVGDEVELKQSSDGAVCSLFGKVPMMFKAPFVAAVVDVDHNRDYITLKQTTAPFFVPGLSLEFILDNFDIASDSEQSERVGAPGSDAAQPHPDIACPNCDKPINPHNPDELGKCWNCQRTFEQLGVLP